MDIIQVLTSSNPRMDARPLRTVSDNVSYSRSLVTTCISSQILGIRCYLKVGAPKEYPNKTIFLAFAILRDYAYTVIIDN